MNMNRKGGWLDWNMVEYGTKGWVGSGWFGVEIGRIGWIEWNESKLNLQFHSDLWIKLIVREPHCN